MGSEKQLAAEPGAGEGNRTLVISLEGFCSTIELHPHTTQTNRFTPDASHQLKVKPGK